MKKSSLTKIIEEIKEAGLESESERYQSINIKPSDSSSALLEVLSRITKKTPSSIINPNFSECIALRLLEVVSSAELLEEAVSDALKKNPTFSKESAIGIINSSDLLKITEKTLLSILLKENQWKNKKHI